MEVAKLSAPPNLEVRYVSCNESAKRRCLSSELEETVFSLTHELFMTQHLLFQLLPSLAYPDPLPNRYAGKGLGTWLCILASSLVPKPSYHGVPVRGPGNSGLRMRLFETARYA